MGMQEIREHLEAGGVWRIGDWCEVVLDPATRNLVVFYKADTKVRELDDRPRRPRPRKAPRKRQAASTRLELCAPARR